MKQHHFLITLLVLIFAYLAYTHYKSTIMNVLNSTKGPGIKSAPGTGA